MALLAVARDSRGRTVWREHMPDQQRNSLYTERQMREDVGIFERPQFGVVPWLQRFSWVDWSYIGIAKNAKNAVVRVLDVSEAVANARAVVENHNRAPGNDEFGVEAIRIFDPINNQHVMAEATIRLLGIDMPGVRY